MTTAVESPLVDEVSMPVVDRGPVCQMGVVHPLFDECAAVAVFHTKIAHSGGYDTSCSPLPYLLCNSHIRMLDVAVRQYRALRCSGCGASIRRPSQLITCRVLL